MTMTIRRIAPQTGLRHHAQRSARRSVALGRSPCRRCVCCIISYAEHVGVRAEECARAGWSQVAVPSRARGAVVMPPAIATAAIAVLALPSLAAAEPARDTDLRRLPCSRLVSCQLIRGGSIVVGGCAYVSAARELEDAPAAVLVDRTGGPSAAVAALAVLAATLSQAAWDSNGVRERDCCG